MTNRTFYDTSAILTFVLSSVIVMPLSPTLKVTCCLWPAADFNFIYLAKRRNLYQLPLAFVSSSTFVILHVQACKNDYMTLLLLIADIVSYLCKILV